VYMTPDPQRKGRVYEVTVVASRAMEFRKLRWHDSIAVIRSLQAFDAIVLTALKEHEGQACVFDVNRRHVRVGYWSKVDDQLERTSGFASIDYFMSDLKLGDNHERRWAKITGNFGASDWVTELPCYTGPAILTHSADGPKQLWNSWPHADRAHEQYDEADPRRYGKSTTVTIDIQGPSNEGVHILTGPSLIDPTSPMGFALLPCWVGYCPGTHELTVALHNGHEPALLASITLADANVAPVKIYALNEHNHPICIATGTIGDPGQVHKLLLEFTVVATSVVAPCDKPNYVRVTPDMKRCCEDTHTRLTSILVNWLDKCRALLVHTECEQPIIPGDMVKLIEEVGGIPAGSIVMVDTLDVGTAVVCTPRKEVKVRMSCLQALPGIIPLGLHPGHELWLKGDECRVRTVVISGGGSITCVKTPLVKNVVGLRNAHEMRCPAPNMYECLDGDALRAKLLRPGVTPSWMSVREEMKQLGNSLGLPGLWIGDEVICNISVARLRHPWGQHPIHAADTSLSKVFITEWNSCTCSSLDCHSRRYCVSRTNWPKDMDRRVSDSMLSWTPEEAIPCFPMGSVVLIEGPQCRGHAVICGGGVDVMGLDILHVVRIGIEREKLSDVIYACIDAKYASLVMSDEAQLMLKAEENYHGLREPTANQLEMQRALIEEEEAHLGDQQMKKRRRAKQKARSVRRIAFWYNVSRALGPRVLFLKFFGPFIRKLNTERRAYLCDLRQLRDLLNIHAPGVLRCPLSDQPLTDPVYSLGHCYNAGPLQEWTDTWGDRQLPVLAGLANPEDPRVVPIQGLVSQLMRLVGFA
jgi:hypothetical protein